MFKVKSKKEKKDIIKNSGSAAPQGDSILGETENSNRSNRQMVMVLSNVYGFLFMFSGLEAAGSDTDIFIVRMGFWGSQLLFLKYPTITESYLHFLAFQNICCFCNTRKLRRRTHSYHNPPKLP